MVRRLVVGHYWRVRVLSRIDISGLCNIALWASSVHILYSCAYGPELLASSVYGIRCIRSPGAVCALYEVSIPFHQLYLYTHCAPDPGRTWPAKVSANALDKFWVCAWTQLGSFMP